MAAPNGSAILRFPEQTGAQAQSGTEMPALWDSHPMAQPQTGTGGLGSSTETAWSTRGLLSLSSPGDVHGLLSIPAEKRCP